MSPILLVLLLLSVDSNLITKPAKKLKVDKDSLLVILGEHFGLKEKANSDDEGTWKEGLSEAEKLFVMGAASQDFSGSDVSLDSTQLKTYQKQYQRVCKKKRSRRK